MLAQKKHISTKISLPNCLSALNHRTVNYKVRLHCTKYFIPLMQNLQLQNTYSPSTEGPHNMVSRPPANHNMYPRDEPRCIAVHTKIQTINSLIKYNLISIITTIHLHNTRSHITSYLRIPHRNCNSVVGQTVKPNPFIKN